jgi:hypothetical protein
MRNRQNDQTWKIGEHLAADLCGLMQTESLEGAKYFMVIKDKISYYGKVYFLVRKEAQEDATN